MHKREIQKHKSGSSVSSVQKIPEVSNSNVQEAEEQPTISGIPVHTNPFRILDHGIHLANEENSVEDDSDEEEVFVLLDPRRHRKECSVSPLDDKQDISDVELSVHVNVNDQSAYRNKEQDCPSPSISNMDEEISENSKSDSPQTMSRSE